MRNKRAKELRKFCKSFNLDSETKYKRYNQPIFIKGVKVVDGLPREMEECQRKLYKLMKRKYKVE